MFNDFCITSIYTDLSLKQVIIETNFKVEENTVNLETVQLVNYDSGSLENYKLQVKEKNIVLILNEWPSQDIQYLIKVTDIKDMLGRSMNSPVSKKIVFVSDIKSKVDIVKPVNNEALTTKIIEIEINAISEEEQVLNYRYEISSDVAFFNMINVVETKDLKTKIELSDGQYYLRARAQGEKDYGDWSEVVTFTVVTNVVCGCTDDNDKFLDDVLLASDFFGEEIEETTILESTKNGTVDNEYYIILNKDIQFAMPLEEEIPQEPPVEEDLEESGLVLLCSIPMYRRDF